MNVTVSGATVQDALERATEQYGSAARLVGADRVRRGGVGGFFARERVEVTVDVEDDPLAGSLPVVTDGADTGPAAPAPSVTTAPPAARVPRPRPQGRPASLLDLADRRSDEEAAATFTPADPPVISTEGAAFGAVLTRIASGLATERGSLVPDDASALLDGDAGAEGDTGGDAPSPPRHLTTTKSGRPTAVSKPPEPVPTSAGAVVSRHAAKSYADPRLRPAGGAPAAVPSQRAAARRATTSEAATAKRTTAKTATAKTTTTPKTSSTVKRRAAATKPAPKKASAAVRSVAKKAGTRTAAPTKATATKATAARSGTRPARRSTAHGSTPDRTVLLRRLGLPERYLPAARGDLVTALSRSLAALPVALPLPAVAGSVIVVAGDGAAAHAAARGVAGMLRVDDRAVHLAAANALGTGTPASRLVTDPRTAAQRRLAWATKDHPVVVALDAPLDPRTHDAALALLQALSPTYVLALCPATTKPTDLQPWVERLALPRVPLALAVEATAASGDPAAVLRLELPVAVLDGRPADTSVWGSLLATRVTAA